MKKKLMQFMLLSIVVFGNEVKRPQPIVVKPGSDKVTVVQPVVVETEASTSNAASAAAPAARMMKMERALKKVKNTGQIDVKRKGRILELNMPGDISFNSDSSTIRRKYYDILDEVADVLYDYEEMKIKIIGHTDSQGSRSYNRDLSLRRAKSVKRYLRREGIRGKRMKVVGRGESDPIASNRTARGRRKNRRVTIEVRGY